MISGWEYLFTWKFVRNAKPQATPTDFTSVSKQNADVVSVQLKFEKCHVRCELTLIKSLYGAN